MEKWLTNKCKALLLWIKKYKVLATGALFLFIIGSPALFTRSCAHGLDFSQTGQIGDTFAIMNPFIAIVAAVLTFIAFWTQYTAIIEPNESAVNGIEAELDGKTTSSNGMNMVFDEIFLGQEVTPTAIEEIIEEAEEKGQKVEYLKVVYSINGQIVREGTSLEGLPKGVYIVNGKKYFVR